MGMSEDFITVIDYLESNELESFKGRLSGTKIKFIVKGHGAKSRYHSAYYEVMVAREDFQQAKDIANKFKVAHAKKKLQCPKCESTLYDRVTNLNFLERIYYSGTTPVKCRKCKTTYVI
jgi:RNase P subunit RPR2